MTNYPAEVNYSKNYEELTKQAEAVFEQKVSQDVFGPLETAMSALDNSNEKPELKEANEKIKALAADIKAINDEFAEKSADLEETSPELALLEAEKESKLKKLEDANVKMYPLALLHMELQEELDAEKEKLEYEQAAEKMENSYAGRIGHAIEPVIKPLGFNWKIGVALLTGFAAKEVVVSTLGTIYSIGEADEASIGLKEALIADPTFSPLVAYALMAFVLIYAPCLAAMAVIKRETNSWKWMAFGMAYTTCLAWVVSFIIYQGGRALGY